MSESIGSAFADNFLGRAPSWYKRTIIAFLVLNPIVLFAAGPFVAGWLLIVEFIFTLALALRCYPLQPGGLLAFEAVVLGMTSPEHVYVEVTSNLPVILLLMFMVAGIFFMKQLLLVIFTRILLAVRSKILLSLIFCSLSALLSAFLDALTVTAVLITVALGLYSVYHRVASGTHRDLAHDHGDDEQLKSHGRSDLEQFRAFLRSLLMHGAVGTALGGACTLVGEPQNLLVAKVAGWEFLEFFVQMAHVTMPVLVSGLATCALVEKFGWFGYGAECPAEVRRILAEFIAQRDTERTASQRAALVVQALMALLLVVALAFHLAEVGLIGLALIVFLTALNGIIDEHHIGEAFQEALPFTALLVVFFAIVAVIHEQDLFEPIIDHALELDESVQPSAFFLASGALSIISDNVFVATVYITEAEKALEGDPDADPPIPPQITREQFDKLVVAINTGTNLPSVGTPNGQAAFLFLLTSALAPLIRLSYGRMVLMALPYTIVLIVVGLLCNALLS